MAARGRSEGLAAAPTLLVLCACTATWAIGAPRPWSLAALVGGATVAILFGFAALAIGKRLAREREALVDSLGKGRPVAVETQSAEESRRAAVAVNATVRRVLEESTGEGDGGATDGGGNDEARFLASLSHTLRTPLNAILGFSEVLESGADGELSSDLAESVSVIRASGEQLAIVIDEILDSCAIDTDTVKLELGTFTVGTMVEDTIKKARSAVDIVEVHVEGGPRVVAFGDPARFRRILLSIMRDVARTARNAWVKWGQERGRAFVQIEDDGPAFEPDDLATLFDRYDPERKRPMRLGFGLGPGVAQTILRAAGGDLRIENRQADAAGIRVRFVLPLDPEAPLASAT